MAQRFIVPFTWPVLHGFALGPYKPFWIRTDAGEKVRNPDFDHYSQQILNIKDPKT